MQTVHQKSSLQIAIEHQDLVRVTQELVADPVLIEQVSDQGVPLSLVAAETGSMDLVKYIVEYSRASMNVVDQMNRNILHYGAISGNVELCKYLVEKVGMSVVSGDRERMTPYEIAVQMGHQELIEYFAGITGTELAGMYKNPIRTGMFPDPSIVRVGEDYYMVNSSFIFFPCIPISHSKDLLHWKIIGHAITNPEWSRLGQLEGGRGYWAPDISYDDGTFYITATYRMNDTGDVYRKQIVVTAKHPAGPYSEPVFLDEDGIDPSIFHENDRHYMLLNRGARIFEINKAGTKVIGEPCLLYYGDHKRAPEGPHLLKKDGYYYLFLAEGGTGLGHQVTVARSRALFGIYEPCPYNPIMQQQDAGAAMQRAGHGKPVCTQNGEWYMVYLCGRMIGDGYSILGRETALDPMQWTADGWPIINQLSGPSVLQKKPDLPEVKVIADGGDSFLTSLWPLASAWVFPREPEADAVTRCQDERMGENAICLKGSKEPLTKFGSRNILLRRQADFRFTARVQLKLPPLEAWQEAGLTGYYDENTWVCFFAGQDGNGYYLQVKEHIGTEDIVHPQVRLKEPTGAVITLGMETDYLHRGFFYESHQGSEPKVVVAELPNVYYLCDEGICQGKRFTGAMVGIYVLAGAEELYGEFRDFEYIPGNKETVIMN